MKLDTNVVEADDDRHKRDKDKDTRIAGVDMKVVPGLFSSDVSFRLSSPISSVLIVLIIASVCYAFFITEPIVKNTLYLVSIAMACAIAYIETKGRP